MGCTDLDIDRASPGYDDEDDDFLERDEQQELRASLSLTPENDDETYRLLTPEELDFLQTLRDNYKGAMYWALCLTIDLGISSKSPESIVELLRFFNDKLELRGDK